MTTQKYLNTIAERRALGNATEHTYRGDLQQLLECIEPSIKATNEPKGIACGVPDYIVTKQGIEVGCIEAKDIGAKDLEGKNKSGNKEQFDRYRSSIENLIFTDYLNFHLYRFGLLVETVCIGELKGGHIHSLPENFELFENLIVEFCAFQGQTIRRADKLADMMAGKARLLSTIIEGALNEDESSRQNSTLHGQLRSFRKNLIHDITPEAFADIYAQTIAYGMFAARLHDPTLHTFSRQEAAELIPESNPFLRRLFGYIAGPDIDSRIKWVVDNLSGVFLACNVQDILRDYGKATETEDPIIHFYETFLSKYDPELKKSRGVWYTPKPVVDFLIRGVDWLLQTDFALPEGLADTTRITIKTKTQEQDQRFSEGYKTAPKKVHKVQILDPAAGTGTFLAEMIKHIHGKFHNQEGLWPSYVERDLLPRMNGFEVLMASYAMAHLQLDLLLKSTGANPDARFRVYLTNSLEEHHPDAGSLFAQWLSDEASEASRIKQETPVMCVVGNPPYRANSSNQGAWIMKLMKDYKMEPGGLVKLKEKTGKWINDDYVKFIRLAQHYIDKNASGIVAFINPHGFLDNPTFRGMRWHLLNSFDKIYTFDLHGNTKKTRFTPQGGRDENVFDIQQGVSINFFVKTGTLQKGALGRVFHAELWGKRERKYSHLKKQSLASINFKEVNPKAPHFIFKPQITKGLKSYQEGFRLDDLFVLGWSCVVTARDKLVVDIDQDSLVRRITFFCDPSKTDEEIRDHFFSNKSGKKYPKGDSRDWKLPIARQAIQNNHHESLIKNYAYRPFDERKIYYSPQMVDWGKEEQMAHLFDLDNVAMILSKPAQGGPSSFTDVFVASGLVDQSIFSAMNRSPHMFPLYRKEINSTLSNSSKNVSRIPNLNDAIISTFESLLDAKFNPSERAVNDSFNAENVFDYIYATLHSSRYRLKYKPFLKVDFPRVPYPKNKTQFLRLAELGKEIRNIHLSKGFKKLPLTTKFPVSGDNTVDSFKHIDLRVYINSKQYIEPVPKEIWEFQLGGYSPAQKWLKDRKGRQLSHGELIHYQKILTALAETMRLMINVDMVSV